MPKVCKTCNLSRSHKLFKLESIFSYNRRKMKKSKQCCSSPNKIK